MEKSFLLSETDLGFRRPDACALDLWRQIINLYMTSHVSAGPLLTFTSPLQFVVPDIVSVRIAFCITSG